MDPFYVKTLRNAVTVNNRSDDVFLPTFDPEKDDKDPENWCSVVKAIARDVGWSDITTVAKAGKVLKGSASSWYESWDPEEGRSWDNFKTTLIDLYSFKRKRNIFEKMTQAVLYKSDAADTYCEYVREKLRLLKDTNVDFTESELVEAVCGGIVEDNVKMAFQNSRVSSTAELISLFDELITIPVLSL